MQPKLEGIRCLADLETGTLWSRRRAKLTFGENENHISAAIKNTRLRGGPRFVDGELFTDGMGFQEIVSIARRTKEPSERVRELHLHVYDAVCTSPFRERRSALEQWYDSLPEGGPIKCVETSSVPNAAPNILRVHETFVDAGYEGCMVRTDSDAPYESGKRSATVAKVKTFLQEEFECVALQPRTNEPIAGSALLRRKMPNGEVVDFAGTVTGTHESRVEMWKNRNVYAHSDKWKATVKFYEYTVDGAPRFPVIVGFRHEDDM